MTPLSSVGVVSPVHVVIAPVPVAVVHVGLKGVVLLTPDHRMHALFAHMVLEAVATPAPVEST